MTRITCNECGKDLSYGTKYNINTYTLSCGYGTMFSSSYLPSNVPTTLDFCSYKCINHYSFKRLAE